MHTAKQWMVTHEWMLKGNHQTEWIEGKGIFLWLAFYFGGLGGGLYLVSLFLNNFWGTLAGWLIVSILKGSCHMVDLGRPSRFWRLILNPGTSWLSRGLLFVIIFSALGLMQLAVSFLLPGSVAEIPFKLIAGLFAIMVMGYPGLVLSKMKGMPLWGIPFLSVLLIGTGLLGGLGILGSVSLFLSNSPVYQLETISQWILIITALFFLAYLFVVSKNKIADIKSESYRSNRRITGITLILVLVLGIVLPLLITLKQVFISIPDYPVIVPVILGELLSGVFFGYYLLKSGVYTPLFTSLHPVLGNSNAARKKRPVTEKWLLKGG